MLVKNDRDGIDELQHRMLKCVGDLAPYLETVPVHSDKVHTNWVLNVVLHAVVSDRLIAAGAGLPIASSGVVASVRVSRQCSVADSLPDSTGKISGVFHGRKWHCNDIVSRTLWHLRQFLLGAVIVRTLLRLAALIAG